MPTYYHNPENALKRANEFCELGKDDEAIECLYDALKNRKSRMIKHIHEMIINKLLQLCVEHRKSQMAKDGLFNYRNLCQGINLKSWEDSVSNYLKLAENKVESAQEAFHSVILDIDDLDQDVTPERLLKCVSSEDAQDRTERVVLLPWIKFLWECYRNCLDLLRSTQNIILYHTVAKNAFRFCVKFSRKSELRKLCNVLKIHAIYMQNKQAWFKNYGLETHLICLDTGFVELDSAIKMELWQDAFKAIENIHALMNISKTAQHSKVMAHYYLKISHLFWVGEEYLFHAVANLRYFSILKDQKKNINPYDIIKLASRVMLSILAVPLPSVNLTTDLVIETDTTVIGRKNKLLASLLNLSKCPTRISLIKDAIQLNINQYLPDKVIELFETLENNSGKIFPSISMSINFIENWSDGEMEEYIPLIQKVFIAKLLPLLSSLYLNMKMTKFLNLTGIEEMSDLEIMLVESARKYEFPLRIDHINMCIHFTNDLNIFKSKSDWDDSLMKELPAKTQFKQLIQVHSVLKCIVRQIHPEQEKYERTINAEKIVTHYSSEKESYRKSLLQRKRVIEKYKESLEKSRLKKEEEEKKRITEKLLKYEAAEKERLLRETEERKLQRFRREQEEIKRKLLLEKMETFKKSVLGSQVVENLELENIDNLDPQILFSKQVEQLNKERKQMYFRLKRQERNFDHFVRAKRIEEIPLLVEQYEKEKETDEKIWNEAVENKIVAAYRKREQEVYKKNRVLEIKQDLHRFLQSVKERSLETNERKMLEFIKMLEEEKQKRLKKRAEERKRKRKEEWIKQQNIEANKEIKFQKQFNLISKGENKQNAIRKNVKNHNIKQVASTKKIVTTPIVDEIIVGEDVSSHKKKISYSEPKKDKYDTSETLEGIRISKDIYYYKTTHKSNAVEAERIEMSEKRSTLSEFSSDLLTKSKSQNQRSNFFGTSNQRVTTNISESNDETLLSWRTPWAQKDSYTNQNSRYNKEREMPRQNITILRRETRSETVNLSKEKKDTEIQKEKHLKADIKFSCTPWAKMKRQAHEE